MPASDIEENFRVNTNLIVRSLYVVLGFAFFIVGIVGIVLPLLPTTPFLLLAAFCFSRGSSELHRWLLSLKYIGDIIKDWEDFRVITLRTKRVATVLLTILLSYPIFFLEFSIILKALAALTGVSVLIFIWSCKGERSEELPLIRA